MSVKDDILALAAMQERVFKNTGKYAQVLPTPEALPATGTDAKVTELRRPTAETEEKMVFIPTAKDAQYAVHVWATGDGKTDDPPAAQGFVIIARRDLGDGVIEETHTRYPGI